jgi:hypothetical protein
MKLGEHLTSFGSNAIIGLLALGLVMFAGSRIVDAGKHANIVPTQTASR